MAKVTRDQKKLLKALKKNPHDPETLVELGWMHFDNHEYPEAKQRFTQVLAEQPNPAFTADATYGLALIEQHGGHYEQARERLRGIFRECPTYAKRAEVHFTLAQVNEHLWRTTTWKNETEKAQSEFLQRAVEHYQQAIERRSEQQAQACFFLGGLYADTQRFDEAIDLLKRALNSPNFEQRYAFDGYALLGRIFHNQKGDLQAAREAFETALKRGAKAEKLAEAHARLGQILRQQGDDAQAVEHFELALKNTPDQQSTAVLDILVNLGELKIRHHWMKEAVNYAERARAIPNLPVPMQARLAKVLTESYVGLREYEKAAEQAQVWVETVVTEQEKAEGFLRAGQIYEHLTQTNKAIDAYRKGLKAATSNPMLSQLNGAVGRMYLQEDRLNQAVNYLKDAVRLADEKDLHTATLYRLLAECHEKREETEQAIEMYGTIIANYAESGEEPAAREALKQFRKQFKKEIQERERAREQAEREEKKPSKATDTTELERLSELVNEILDEKGFFQRLKEGLAKTHLSLVSKIEALLAGKSAVDDELIENLEEILILSDLGVATTQRIITTLQEKVKRKELEDPKQVKLHLKREVMDILQGSEKTLEIEREKPFVILVIGVNGTGKTTTIGKMASKFKALGKEVLLVAGDTFRAAAIEQLEIWGERTGCDVIKHASGSDPAAVMFDAIQAAKSRNVDILIADTAGRLHTKVNLMEELKKIVRVISRELPGAPHEILMVVDATTGQNAISQAQLFHQGVGVSGLVLTKLDGTAKGGIVASIAHDLKIPVVFIGIGEKVEDLRQFNAKEFVEALFED